MDMTLTQALGIVVPGLSFAKSWVYGNKWKYAPAYGMFIQLCWITYTLCLGKDAIGMIVLAAVLFFVELRNLIKWNRN